MYGDINYTKDEISSVAQSHSAIEYRIKLSGMNKECCLPVMFVAPHDSCIYLLQLLPVPVNPFSPFINS